MQSRAASTRRQLRTSYSPEMEEVLADWLRRGAARDAMASLATGVEYRLYTPYGNEAAACWIREPR
jgi:hypothetical protein